MNERDYRNGMLEGGEGYNPYNSKETTEPVNWMTYLDKRDSLVRSLGYISTSDPRYAEKEAQLVIVEAELKESKRLAGL